jgi:putative glutamine amidotransferase
MSTLTPDPSRPTAGPPNAGHSNSARPHFARPHFARPHFARPRIGLTLDAEAPGGYSAYPWYALRTNYAGAIAEAGGLPLPLPHLPDLAGDMLDSIDALIVTGGAFDVSPTLYGASGTHGTVTLKESRTLAEMALLQGALGRNMPVLGICGGEQLLAVVLGGTLIQHIPDAVPDALPHEQPNPRHEPGHEIRVAPGTRLHAIVGADTMRVNSSHHQAVQTPGAGATINATASDGVIEGIEDPSRPFCLGVQWHPEFQIDQGDRRIFLALMEAARAYGAQA